MKMNNNIFFIGVFVIMIAPQIHSSISTSLEICRQDYQKHKDEMLLYLNQEIDMYDSMLKVHGNNVKATDEYFAKGYIEVNFPLHHYTQHERAIILCIMMNQFPTSSKIETYRHVKTRLEQYSIDYLEEIDAVNVMLDTIKNISIVIREYFMTTTLQFNDIVYNNLKKVTNKNTQTSAQIRIELDLIKAQPLLTNILTILSHLEVSIIQKLKALLGIL